MTVRLARTPSALDGVVILAAPLRDLAAGLLAVVAATAGMASAILDPHADPGVDLTGLKPFDTPDELAM